MPVGKGLLQVFEVNAMKLNAIHVATAIVVAAAVGAASAAEPGKAMQPVTATALSPAGCLPPNDATGHACDAFNQLVRSNFTSREIGMLFGNVSSYPESLTGGIDRLQRRYQVLLQEYVAARQADQSRIATK